MACRSASGNPLSHSRTGSLPVWVRKKIRGIFCGGESSAILPLDTICTIKGAGLDGFLEALASRCRQSSRAAHRDHDLAGKFANPFIAKSPEAAKWLRQTLFANDGNILGAGC